MHGDMLEKVAELGDASVDAIVTDPPYHLTTGKKGGSGMASLNVNSPAGRSRIGTGFMGMRWDGGDIAMRPETWALLLRVARPGAHLLVFGGARTFHRVWCAVEDAGWEIRDTLMWLHGEGFPKSSNQHGDWEGWGTALKPAFEPILMARKSLIGTVAANLEAHRVGALNIEACRVPVTDGVEYARNFSDDRGHEGTRDAGEQGATNMRMGGGSRPLRIPGKQSGFADVGVSAGSRAAGETTLGRWPANVLHDGSEEVLASFPNAPGALSSVSGNEPSTPARNVYGTYSRRPAPNLRGDSGSAARFFWCPKASRTDRNEGLEGMPRQAVNWSSGDQSPGTFQSPNTDRENENFHPTVKPTELMQYLIRLVTPLGGIVLDPFMGSGSTGKAAMREGMSFVGIEIDEQYIEIARRRIVGVAPLFAEVTL